MEVRQYVIGLVSENAWSDDEISVTEQSSFADLGLDDLDLLGFSGDCEFQFEVDIEDEEVVSLKTVGELIALVEKKRAEEAQKNF